MNHVSVAAKSNSDEGKSRSRYVVGIDLGTTNSAVGFVDTLHEEWRIQSFAIPQLVAPGEVESRQTLPSFHYEPPESDVFGDHQEKSKRFVHIQFPPRPFLHSWLRSAKASFGLRMNNELVIALLSSCMLSLRG